MNLRCSVDLRLFLLLCGSFLFCGVSGYDNPYRHVEVLDRAGTYKLEWAVDWDTKRITFNVTAATKGYVGFGLSRKGFMDGADMIIGGVGKDGKPYFSDRHAVGHNCTKDASQDWELHSAWERGNMTSLKFSRALDTCDENDYPITNDLTTLIWSYSEGDDDTQYHYWNRGSFNAYLLDPDLTPRDLEDVKAGTASSEIKVFTLTKQIVLRQQETQYWCTFHKVPLSRGQRHIIGFNTTFPTDTDRRHVHHLLLHRCRAPPGRSQDDFFGPASRTGGSECYILDIKNPLPVPYCREVTYIWAVNSRPIFMPSHAGILLDTNLDQDEYLMFQAHYDNPNSTNTPVTVELDIYYTETLRQFNVGTLQLGNLQPGATTILVPPMEREHYVLGHCAPGCTARMFPPEGINVFAAHLHTHISGTGVRVLHLRNGQELPWIQYDDNYSFDFQQFRVFREEVKVLPGDQLIERCTYDSTPRNGTALQGGFSTRQEMCTTFMWYYSHSPGFALCRSEIRTQRYNEGLLGVGNMTWNQTIRQMVITDPPNLAGTTIEQHINTNIDWNIAMRERLQEEQIYETQVSQCPRFHYTDATTQLREQLDSGILLRTGRIPALDGQEYTSVDEDFEHESTYPRGIIPYQAPPTCTRRSTNQLKY